LYSYKSPLNKIFQGLDYAKFDIKSLNEFYDNIYFLVVTFYFNNILLFLSTMSDNGKNGEYYASRGMSDNGKNSEYYDALDVR